MCVEAVRAWFVGLCAGQCIRAGEGTFAWCVPGIQINAPASYPNALPPSYRAWGALFAIAKAQVIQACLEEAVARERNEHIDPLLALLGTQIGAQIPLC